MFTVLIDTSAYETHGLSFEGSVFDSLLALSENEKIKLVTSSIIQREIEAHLKDSIAKSVNMIERACEKFDHNTKKNLGQITSIISDSGALKNEIFQSRQLVMVEYFEQIDAEELDISQIEISKVLDDYFEKRPPFGEGKKKSEFPDSILLKSFISTNEGNLPQICFVSADPDWKRFSDKHPTTRHFKSIPEFLDFINTKYDAVFTRSLKQALDTKADYIKSNIIEQIETSSDFSFDDQWYDPEADVDSESISVEILDQNILTYSETSAEWGLDLKIKYTLEVSATDGDSWYKDPDTKEIFYMGTNTYQIDVIKKINATLEASFDSHAIHSTFHVENIELPSDTYYIDNHDEHTTVTETSNWQHGFNDHD